MTGRNNREEHVLCGLMDRFIYGHASDGESTAILSHCKHCCKCSAAAKERLVIRILQKAAGIEPSDLIEECVDFTELRVDEGNQDEVFASIKPHLKKCVVCQRYFSIATGGIDVYFPFLSDVIPPLGQRADKSQFDIKKLQEVF